MDMEDLTKDKKMYEYKAKIIRVYDGDTMTFLIDLGFNLTITGRLRLYGVNTPEIRRSKKTTQKQKKKGLAIRDYVRKMILNKDVNIQVLKKGKYGRYVSKVSFSYLGKSVDLSDHLVDRGMAVKVKY